MANDTARPRPHDSQPAPADAASHTCTPAFQGSKLRAATLLADRIAALALEIDPSAPDSFYDAVNRVNRSGELEKVLADRVFAALRTGDEWLDEGVRAEAEQEAAYQVGLAVGRRLAVGVQ